MRHKTFIKSGSFLRHRVFLYSVIIGTLLFSGCKDDTDTVTSGGGSLRLTASIEGQSISRTAPQSSGITKWSEDDKIGVFGTQTVNAPFTYTSSDDQGITAVFSGKTDKPDEEVKWAYYPYDNHVVTDGRSLTIDLPDTYTYDGNLNVPMIATGGSQTLTFKHLCGLLCITTNRLPEDASRFTITSTGEASPYLTGIGTVEDVTSSNPALTINSTGGRTITYHLGNLTAAATGFKTIFVPIPAGDYPQLEISLYGEGKTEPYFTRTLSQQTIRRAEMLQVPILNGETGESYVLNKNTQMITDDQLKYVSPSPEDPTTLIYSADLSNNVPKVGNVLWAPVSDTFPYGFLGKVSEVSKSKDGSAQVKTVTAPLSEAFDELYVDEIVEFIPQEGQRGLVSRGYVEGDFSSAVDIELSLAEHYDVVGKLQFTSKLRANIELSKESGKDYVSLVSEEQYDMGIQTKFFAHSESEKGGTRSLLPKPINGVPMPLAGGLINITPSLNLYWTYEREGDIAYQAYFHTTQHSLAGAELKNGQWKTNRRDIGNSGGSPWDLEGSIDFDGRVFVGVGFEIAGKFYGRDDAKMSLKVEGGGELSGQLSIDLEDLQQGKLNVEEAKLSSAVLIRGKMGVDASVFAPGLKIEATIAELRLRIADLYVLPLLEKLKLTRVTDSQGTSIEAQTNTTRETLSKDMQISLDVRNSKGESVQTSEDKSYQGVARPDGDNWTLPSMNIKETFENIPEGDNYTVVPIIKSPILKDIPELKEYVLETASASIDVPSRSEGDLRNYLIKLYQETNGPAWPESERTNWCTNLPLTEWAGVTAHPSIKGLYRLEKHGITGNVDFSGCKSLETINIYGNINTLNVSDCPMLVEFDTDAQNILARNCDGLDILSLNVEKCASADLSGCMRLSNLSVQGIEKLIVSHCPSLTYLDISGNHALKYLDASECDRLYQINYITYLPSIPLVLIGGENLEYLNVSGCTSLEDCFGGHSTDNPEIMEAEGYERICYIETRRADASTGQEFERTLHIPEETLLKEINFSGVKAFEKIFVKGKQLEYLNLSNTHLWEIYDTSFLDSHVRNLDISGCLELKKAYIKGNQSTVIPLQKLNASNCSSLQYLNCQNSLLSDLSVSGCNNLLEFDVKNTMMKENVDEFLEKNNILPTSYDCRYGYEYVILEDFKPQWYVSRAIDRGIGWWFTGEPGQGYHTEEDLPCPLDNFGGWLDEI
jgi:Leucine-rich repeat (LRR) protein